MKKIFFLLVAIPFFAIAQKAKTAAKPKTIKAETIVGVHFQHKITNWNNLIAQAKKENKFVFVDCYTTWCGPCKYVSTKVFPLKNVGEFFNTNFVNVGLQLDETKKDNEDVIATRSVAKQIEATYKINAYPTFLIFDNTGKLVHKFVGAGDDKMMITNATAGLNKDEQYYTLVEGFKAGNRDGNFIAKLCKTTAAAGDNAEEYLKAFIETQTHLFTKENAELLLSNVESTDGIAFKNLYQNKEKWVKVTDKGKIDEELQMAIGGEVEHYMAVNRKNNINWDSTTKAYTEKYLDLGKIAILKTKADAFARNKNFSTYSEIVAQLINEFPNSYSANEFNEMAWYLFENSNDKTILTQALGWSKKSIEGVETIAYIDTYANILYKLGRTSEAIEAETKALSKATNADEKKSYQETLDKMKKGEKT